MLPTATPDALRAAISRFDSELRSTPAWRDWETKKNHRFAIHQGGRLYPVKQILAMATGEPTSAFGGLQGANRVLQAAGFEVIALHATAPADEQPMARLRGALENILANYLAAKPDDFSNAHPMAQQFAAAGQALAAVPEVVPRKLKVVPSAGKGNWASVPWISILDPRETETTQRGVYVVYLFRGDMSGVYATLNQGVTELKELSSAEQTTEMGRRAAAVRAKVPELAAAGFSLDSRLELRSSTPLGQRYEPSTIAHKFYPADALPDGDELADDLHALLDAYDSYIRTKNVDESQPATLKPSPTRAELFEGLIARVADTGFVFEPWQLAAYVTALRTKPFVILAGVSGTGKSKLPQLVAAATGARFERIAVRPDWTDSSDVLGYVDLQGTFRPGSVLRFAREAEQTPGAHHVCLLDEMNLARVEQYFAELLSGMEDRHPAPAGGFSTARLLAQPLPETDAAWNAVGWGANLALVGTVNMDETTHGFSRKVLDRAFTLEISEVDLGNWRLAPASSPAAEPWPLSMWHPRALRLSDIGTLTDSERATVTLVVDTLTTANRILSLAQLQIGYRVRDELALFALHAEELKPWFRTQTGDPVDPLDLAISMKLLPRIAGGSGAVRRVLLRLLSWATSGRDDLDDEDVLAHVTRWDRNARPAALEQTSLPRTAGRLCLMWDRLQQEGFTSYWL